jgi:hypothetical protein
MFFDLRKLLEVNTAVVTPKTAYQAPPPRIEKEMEVIDLVSDDESMEEIGKELLLANQWTETEEVSLCYSKELDESTQMNSYNPVQSAKSSMPKCIFNIAHQNHMNNQQFYLDNYKIIQRYEELLNCEGPNFKVPIQLVELSRMFKEIDILINLLASRNKPSFFSIIMRSIKENYGKYSRHNH